MPSRRSFLQVLGALFAAPALFTGKQAAANVVPQPSAPSVPQPKKRRGRKHKKTLSDAEQRLNKSLKDKRECYEKWLEVGMLNGLEEDFAVEMACLLENQRLMNEIASDTADTAQFRRLSIALARRMFSGTLNDLVSVQTMLGPTYEAFYRDPNGVLDFNEVAAKTMRRKAVWGYEAAQDLRAVHNLDAEAELCAVLSEELGMEMVREVLTDIRNLADRRTFDKPMRHLPEALAMAFRDMSERTGRPDDAEANWTVGSPEMISHIEANDPTFRGRTLTWSDSLGICCVGQTKTCRLYRDPLFPTNQMVLGSKHGHHEAGYIFLPYVPLSMTPVVLDPERFCPVRGFLTRHAKRLVEPKMYMNMVIDQLKG